MPDLIQAAIAAGEPVISFPVREYWLDIGHMAQYEKAQVDVAGGIV
jgi:NDP-sugar pyrophosphorylase family protein